MSTNSMWHPGIPVEYRDRVVCGDARVLSKGIPHNSIDLVFTDPVYNNTLDYAWLAETALRVCKPDTAILVWIANPQIHKVLDAMAVLSFVMPLNYIKTGGTNMIFSRRVFGWCKMCLWFEKGTSQLANAIPDTVLSGKMPEGSHKWNKNTEAMTKWLDAFTQPGGVVLDPFCGGGTVPAACKQLGRHYIAFEIDPTTAHNAQHRVDNTQPPLFVLNDEQLSLDLE